MLAGVFVEYSDNTAVCDTSQSGLNIPPGSLKECL